ncbi:MAG TPA: glycosyltransferase family 87 protein, partial [Pseudolabrys sp.]|nr:glycosyltransferase family 87 protein [Pseudolabrys sp.]
MARFVDRLRSGSWLTRERARLVALAMLVAGLAGAVYVVVTANGLSDRFGRPLGTDFSSFYAAGALVDDGLPAAPFDFATHYTREQKIFGTGTPDYSFSYPPTFLLVAAALALLNYLPALLLWQGATFGLYLWAMRAIFRGNEAARAESAGWMPLLLTAAFPAVFVNLGHGQNGFLTAGLFGMALAVLERRPVLAGILFGLLSYKPQFGVLIPLVLAASGRWRAFAAAAATVALMTLAVTAAFGSEVWSAFFAFTKFTRIVVLEQGGTGWYKIQSVFSWVRMWGGGI